MEMVYIYWHHKNGSLAFVEHEYKMDRSYNSGYRSNELEGNKEILVYFLSVSAQLFPKLDLAD